MPIALKPPSAMDYVTFPVFAMSWFANPHDGTSIIAYCGGGGSAKTGVRNVIVIPTCHLPPPNELQQQGAEGGGEDEDLLDAAPLEITTGDEIGTAIRVFQNEQTGQIWMLVGLNDKVHRYKLPGGEAAGEINVQEPCNALNVNAMGDVLAVGCESGLVKVYSIDSSNGEDDQFEETGGDPPTPMYVCKEHDKAVCDLHFSVRGDRLLTSGKDGMACIWHGDRLLAGLKCSVEDEDDDLKKKKALKTPARPQRAKQVIVKGCAFCDLEGHIVLTVASGRRGSGFLAQWVEAEDGRFHCVSKINCSPRPISAVSVSSDGDLLALGNTDGSVFLWDITNQQQWKLKKAFNEVHDLPVTCIAARPYALPLRGEEEGIQFQARTASGDNRFSLLSWDKPPRKPRSGGGSGGFFKSAMSFMTLVNRLVYTSLLMWLLSPVFNEARGKCGAVGIDLHSLQQCLWNEMLVAPSTRPGVMVAPY